MHIILSVGQILDHRQHTLMQNNLHLNSHAAIHRESNVTSDIIHTDNNSTFLRLLLDRNWQSTCSRATMGILSLNNAIYCTSVCVAHTCICAHTCVCVRATVWATLNPSKSQQQHSSSLPQPRTHHQEETQRGEGEEGRGGEEKDKEWRGERKG